MSRTSSINGTSNFAANSDAESAACRLGEDPIITSGRLRSPIHFPLDNFFPNALIRSNFPIPPGPRQPTGICTKSNSLLSSHVSTGSISRPVM